MSVATPNPTPVAAPLLTLTQVVKVRERGGQRFELEIEDMPIQRGEFIAVVGESGCGKSTTLDMLGLVLRPTRAAGFAMTLPDEPEPFDLLTVSDACLAGLRRSALGYILQTGGLFPFLTVRENILLTCRINQIEGRTDYVEDLCTRLGIEHQLGKKPQFLSGGQRQRVAIARSLAHEPPLILADEPTGAVDKLTAIEIRNTFKELTQQMNMTVIMVTHDLALVKDVADRTFTYEISRPRADLTRSVCREVR